MGKMKTYILGTDGSDDNFKEEAEIEIEDGKEGKIKFTSKQKLMISIPSWVACNFMGASVPFGAFFLLDENSVLGGIVRIGLLVLINVAFFAYLAYSKNFRKKLSAIAEMKGYTNEEAEENYDELVEIVKTVKAMKKN